MASSPVLKERSLCKTGRRRLRALAREGASSLCARARRRVRAGKGYRTASAGALQKSPRIGVARPGEEDLSGCILDQTPLVENKDAVAHVSDGGEVVADEEDRQFVQ